VRKTPEKEDSQRQLPTSTKGLCQRDLDELKQPAVSAIKAQKTPITGHIIFFFNNSSASEQHDRRLSRLARSSNTVAIFRQSWPRILISNILELALKDISILLNTKPFALDTTRTKVGSSGVWKAGNRYSCCEVGSHRLQFIRGLILASTWVKKPV